MYTVTEVAKMFSVSRQTVLKWINNGKIKAVKVVKVYRIPKEEIDRLIDKQRKEDEKKMKRMDNNTCCGCIYENIDDTTEDISKCVCCKRNFEYAKNDYYTRKEDEGK